MVVYVVVLNGVPDAAFATRMQAEEFVVRLRLANSPVKGEVREIPMHGIEIRERKDALVSRAVDRKSSGGT